MYSRYKVKRNNPIIIRIVIFLVIASALVFVGSRYRQYLFFWKYTSNKIVKKINQVEKMKNGQAKTAALDELVKTVESYRDDNPVAPDVYLQSGKVRFLAGESMLTGSFSELVINDKVHAISTKSRRHFIRSIKDFRKASALLEDDALPSESALQLAKASFYTGYKTPEEIYGILERNGVLDEDTDIEGVRFCAVIEILTERVDRGLKRLVEEGDIYDSIQGRLLLATVERMAQRYTNAIMHYKEVRGLTSDRDILKLVHLNLGKLYFSRSLYQESLTHFNAALEIDSEDTESRIWIGKNYARLGERLKAKAVWTEVLTRDSSNDEAKKLLGIM